MVLSLKKIKEHLSKVFFQLYWKCREEFFHPWSRINFFFPYQEWDKLTFYRFMSQKALRKKGVAFIQDKKKENVAGLNAMGSFRMWGKLQENICEKII